MKISACLLIALLSSSFALANEKKVISCENESVRVLFERLQRHATGYTFFSVEQKNTQSSEEGDGWVVANKPIAMIYHSMVSNKVFNNLHYASWKGSKKIGKRMFDLKLTNFVKTSSSDSKVLSSTYSLDYNGKTLSCQRISYDKYFEIDDEYEILAR